MIISKRTVVNTGISASDIRNMTLVAVEARFGGYRAPHLVERFSENGSPNVDKDTRIFE